jgi:chromosome partitioning protein
MIISSISYKGGVGKTTVAQNIAVGLASSGYKVCIVDADESQNSMFWATIRGEREPFIKVTPNNNPDTIRKTIADLYDREGYEVVIIDSPPSISKIASKIILSSHLVIVPVSVTGAQDVATTEKFIEHYFELLENYDKKIPTRFVLNNYQTRIKLHQAVESTLMEISKENKIPIFDTRLHRRAAYGEASTQGLGVIELSDQSAKTEIINLTNEITALI